MGGERPGGGRGGRKCEWLDRAHRTGRPRRPWTAARTTKMLRRCPLAIAQQLVYHAFAVSAVVQSSHKDNFCRTAVE